MFSFSLLFLFFFSGCSLNTHKYILVFVLFVVSLLLSSSSSSSLLLLSLSSLLLLWLSLLFISTTAVFDCARLPSAREQSAGDACEAVCAQPSSAERDSRARQTGSCCAYHFQQTRGACDYDLAIPRTTHIANVFASVLWTAHDNITYIYIYRCIHNLYM